MWFNKPTSKSTGAYFEQLAKQYLIDKGLLLITENFHSRFGEIDLIMKDGDYLVFIEVKYRANNMFGEPSELVDQDKQIKIANTAQIYLQKHELSEYNTLIRFDVVSIKGPASSAKINWLKNAFHGV